MRTRIAAGAAAACAAALLAGCTASQATPATPDATGYPALNVAVTLSALACEPSGACVAAGTNPTAASGTSSIEVSPGGTHHWRAAAVQPLVGVSLPAASCWSSGCLLGGTGPNGTVVVLVNPSTFASSSLSTRPPGSGISALSCNGPGRCLALVAGTVSTIVFSTSDSGQSWHQIASLPAALQGGTSLSCFTARRCVAGGTGPKGAAIAWSDDGGRRWRLAAHPGDLQVVTSVSCSSATCVATARKPDGNSLALRSSNAGIRFVALPTHVANPVSSWCASPTLCLVGGGASAGGAISSFTFTPGAATAGSTTTTQAPAPSEQVLTLAYVPDPVIALGCATTLRCAAVTPASTVSLVP